METDRITVTNLIVSTGVVLCVEVGAGALATGMPSNPMLLLGMIRVLETALLLSAAVISGNGLSSLGLARSGVISGFARGLLWSFGFGLSALGVFLILYAFGVNGMALIHTRLPESPGAIGLLFLVGGLVGPAAEELFFRGILYGFFRRWGVFVALTVSTLVFVLAHPGFPHIPFTQVVGGIVFAAAYEIEGSLAAPLTIHILGNTAIFALSMIA
jgi:membrane protease YdiL (CAAX protease family)